MHLRDIERERGRMRKNCAQEMNIQFTVEKNIKNLFRISD